MIPPDNGTGSNTAPAFVNQKRAFYATPDQKPNGLPLLAEGIPEELRALSRWVPWRYQWKPDKKGGGTWAKVPLSAKTGRAADCNKPSSWGTFEHGLKLLEAGIADGIGFAFVGGGYVGLDLDGHRDPATGTLTPFAQLVLAAFDTYSEVSASGTGVKLIGRGVLLPDAPKTAADGRKFKWVSELSDKPPAVAPKKVAALGLELFDRGFFALTGHAVPGTAPSVRDVPPIAEFLATLPGADDATKRNTFPPAIVPEGTNGTKRNTSKSLKTDAPASEPGPAAPDAPAPALPASVPVPAADEVIERVRGHADGEALWNGDTSAHNGDHSGADLALCNLIAFYAGPNPDLIDTVFRGSGLMRDKWDERHARDGRTYGTMTVQKALESKREFFAWSPKLEFSATPAAGAPPNAPSSAEADPWPEMGGAAYHGLAGEFVRFVEPQTEADPVALLVQFLTMFGSAAGRGAYVRVERTRHHPNEFGVLVGPSAKGRKGTSEAWPSDLLWHADEEWAKNCRAGKLASGEALVWALRDAIFGIVDGEPQCIDEGITDKRLLITEGEFSAILKIAAKEQNTLSDQLRDAWDGKDLHNKNKASPCQATGAHVSIVAHTNESDLKLLLTENAMANGFGNRFMFFAVRRSKLLPFGGNVDEEKFAELAARVAERLEEAREESRVPWGAEAAALWDTGGTYAHLSRERHGLAGNLTSRAEAHVVRLALLYALLDGKREIGLAHLEAALAVWNYAEATAYRLFGSATGDPLAEDLLRYIRGAPAGIGRWKLHECIGKNTQAAKIGAALQTLRARNLARCEMLKTTGRAAETWFAVNDRGTA